MLKWNNLQYLLLKLNKNDKVAKFLLFALKIRWPVESYCNKYDILAILKSRDNFSSSILTILNIVILPNFFENWIELLKIDLEWQFKLWITFCWNSKPYYSPNKRIIIMSFRKNRLVLKWFTSCRAQSLHEYPFKE